MQSAGQGTTKSRAPKTIQGKVRTMADPAQQKSIGEYQHALQWMQEGRFEKAREAFDKLVANGPAELVERSKVYLAACDRNAKKAGLTFGGPEEQYDYAISLLNTGFYEEAREQFEAILEKSPKADYVLYGLAILESMTGQAEGCLRHLESAIELNGRNRIQARADSDFQDMADDPRFTELLYPEMS